MKKSPWPNAIQSSADPGRVRHFLELLKTTNAASCLKHCDAEQARILAALFAGSQALSNALVARPKWINVVETQSLRHPRQAQGFRTDADTLLKPLLANGDFAVALDALRSFKHREMLRIAARDLARMSNVTEITRELSDLTDVCLNAVCAICFSQCATRYGIPFHQDTTGRRRQTTFCVLGMGKLGGQELNYSSDVDVLFVYEAEGEVFKSPPSDKSLLRAVMSNHQFFCKLGETFIAEVSRVTGEGFIHRIDLRLRPEGNAGPLARSLESYETYYAQWGQPWERMMLIKARPVAGDATLGGEFLETVQSFRFPRFIGEGVLREVAAVKSRIENEIVGTDELDRNVKLGRGGIREIEFTVQTLQLLHAGRQPFLQITQTLPCLAKLAQYKLLTDDEARQLTAAYCFLRDVEHRLQMDENLQTHTIPADRAARERMARLMDFKSWTDFETARAAHCANVRRIYDRFLKSGEVEIEDAFPPRFDGSETEWKAFLKEYGFCDPDRAFSVLKEFVEGPGYVNVSPRTTALARQLLPKLFALCPEPGRNVIAQSAIGCRRSVILSDPDRVVTRLDSYISAYGARSTLFELWTGNPALFELLLLLFDRSEFLAEVAIRTPDLVDDLVSSGWMRRKKSADEILKELRLGAGDADQLAWLRRYHETEFMRIGLRDILGLADGELNFEELSALADACLQYSLETVLRRNKLKSCPIVIIGLGKLGGREINYGSDLDLLFVTDAKVKELPGLQKLATEVLEMMSRRTEQGIVFITDARLRPDGEKGLLVNTLAAFEDYYRQRAQLWEIQSLTRTRPVAGDMKLGEQFQQMAAKLTNFCVVGQASRLSPTKKKIKPDGGRRDACPALPSCVAPDWKQHIHQMRMRIEKERTPQGRDELAFKTGRGGLMDAEFIAQTLCLERGWHEPNTLRALERGRDEGALADAETLLVNYRQLRRMEGILRRWSYEGESVLPDDPAPYYRVSVRCGYKSPEAFREALAGWRREVRKVYETFFGV
ncbi:MAG TPA: bifunctional [glutamate--ammonia ligase]-adenylyl-L-tyrosine phosphorylase/[glutamate--ammonia-ligase] adenylyltransferase [Verrucomicrobiota bacterium]|nr:bifunctional [glutamate--ammonia ligase]-adenylyl-L-tyrosine phosphorylase/[glutamate--ammonia-ligase] adenylyltransferase [Verrucomicrobiota bacterium]